ncbi:MAG: hypothetical protein AAF500_03195 [Myxococcota bacterium]
MRLGAFSWVVLAVFGCDSLSEFNTGDDEIYTGAVAGVNDPEVCPDDVDCSFIRRGFPFGTSLDLRFDPFSAFDDPGAISTRGEACAPTFEDTPLLPIPPLAHDQLGLYEIPGRGRLRNYMFVARPESGPLAGRDAMVFMSLIRGGSIEVRVVAGSGLTICDPNDCAELEAGDCDFYGFFSLDREAL